MPLFVSQGLTLGQGDWNHLVVDAAAGQQLRLGDFEQPGSALLGNP